MAAQSIVAHLAQLLQDLTRNMILFVLLIQMPGHVSIVGKPSIAVLAEHAIGDIQPVRVASIQQMASTCDSMIPQTSGPKAISIGLTSAFDVEIGMLAGPPIPQSVRVLTLLLAVDASAKPPVVARMFFAEKFGDIHGCFVIWVLWCS